MYYQKIRADNYLNSEHSGCFIYKIKASETFKSFYSRYNGLKIYKQNIVALSYIIIFLYFGELCSAT